jgi:hypothetical protein
MTDLNEGGSASFWVGLPLNTWWAKGYVKKVLVVKSLNRKKVNEP